MNPELNHMYPGLDINEANRLHEQSIREEPKKKKNL